MNKEIELRPCPFCGEQPIVYDNYDMNGFDVSCNNGECAFQPTNDWLMKTREAAITAWNTRPIEAQLQAENERLRRALETITRTGDKVSMIKTAKAALQHNEVENG